MNDGHEYAYVGDLHLEAWEADGWAHSRVENSKTHEQLYMAKSKHLTAVKVRALAFAQVTDKVEWVVPEI
jgi:hypothetical protein